jgi:hypothetical protein
VWCEISSEGITGPYFFENAEEHAIIVNTGWYKAMLETFLQNELFMEQVLKQHRFPWQFSGCFQEESFLILRTSTGPPTHLILWYKITSFEVTSKARYTRHVLPILMT